MFGRSLLALAFAGTAAHAADPSPEAVVARQVAAYGRGDAVAFADCYAPDARIYDAAAGEAPTLSGRDAIRAHYAESFRRAPGRRAIILGRLVNGAYVTDRERLSGTQTSALVTYEVRGGLIARAWLFVTVPR